MSIEQNIKRLDAQIDRVENDMREEQMSAETVIGKLEMMDSWLKDNAKIAALTTLIPQAKAAAGELAYITKGEYRKLYGISPRSSILTQDGKRVMWEYALDDMAKQLGLEEQYGAQADEALKRMIELARRYKQERHTLKTSLENSKEYVNRSKQRLEDITVNISRHMEVKEVQDSRSNIAKAVDNAKTAQHVLRFPNVQPWLRSPGHFDVVGVDTHRHKPKRKGFIRRFLSRRSDDTTRLKGV